MSHEPLPKPEPRPSTSAKLEGDTSSSERARILLALIDQQENKSGLGQLTEQAKALQSGLEEGSKQELPSRETLLKSARDLLARLEPGAKAQTKTRSKPTARPLKLPRSVLRSTIAALIGESDLKKEHPAVIAIVLENQNAKTKAAVLRELPGPIARRVQRSMDAVKDVA